MKACLTARRLQRLVAGAGALAAAAICGLAAACGEPSRLPVVLPLTPSSEVFLLTGTVTESAPNTSTTVPHAQLALDGVHSGVSVTSDENGRFSFGEIKGGRFNLFASRDGYESATYAIELKRDSDYAIRLSRR